MTRLLAADAAGIAEAAALLRGGALVAFGTETVYGLGADATDARAVAEIFAVKGRPRFNPLICHFSDADAAWAEAEPTELARALATQFWPGPLTLVLDRRAASLVAPLAAGGLGTLALRVPVHPVALALLAAVGRPVAAPSANPSGRVSPTTAAHVIEGLGGRIAAVLDSGPCAVGVESTVVEATGPRPVLLRAGGVTAEAIAAVAGPVERPLPDDVRAPGMLAAHYAPALPLRLAATEVAADEALLAFGSPLPGAHAVFQLSERGDLTEAAAHLFAGLRVLGAASGCRAIAAMPIPPRGLGEAINDRLRRAAAAAGR